MEEKLETARNFNFMKNYKTQNQTNYHHVYICEIKLD